MLQGEGHETAEMTFSSSGLLKRLKTRIMSVLNGMDPKSFCGEGTHIGVFSFDVVFASNRRTLILVMNT